MAIWQLKLKARWNKQSEYLELSDVKEIFGAFQKIQPKFVQDLKRYAKTQGNYLIESAIEELRTPAGLSVQVKNFLLVWGADADKRPYQLLIEKETAGYFLAAVGPSDFSQFLKDAGKAAIGAILALIASPSKMSAVLVYVSHVEPPQFKREDLLPQKSQFVQWAQTLNTMPNVDGQWFPTFAPKCPICNATLVGLENYQVGFGQMICPRCGYKKM